MERLAPHNGAKVIPMTTTTISNTHAFATRANGLALWLILLVSLIGVAFSGTLSYRELRGSPASCAASSVAFLGAPSCVYGLLMFVFIAAMAAWGLLGAARASGSPPDRA